MPLWVQKEIEACPGGLERREAGRGGRWPSPESREAWLQGNEASAFPAEAFKYGRGPGTRGAAGGVVCRACGLGGRRCPRERDLHGRCVPALEVGKHRSLRDAPFSRLGYARGPGPLPVRGGAPYSTIPVPLFGPGGNQRRALAGGQQSRAFNSQLASSS